MDIAVFEATIADGQQITKTTDAIAENIEVAEFAYNSLPNTMILGDKAKLEQIIKDRGLTPLNLSVVF